MPVYKFKVTFDDLEEISRDIEIMPTQSFDDLHHSIQKAIGFDGTKPAHFFICNHSWRKEKEIAQDKLKKPIVAYLDDPHQKFLYEFEPAWSLQMELFKILPEEKGATYPRCVKSIGAAPTQYKPTNIAAPEEDEEDKDSIDDSGFYREPEVSGLDGHETEDMEEDVDEDIEVPEEEVGEDFEPGDADHSDFEEKY